MKLNVNEIFYSLQGEGQFTGCPAVFIRLSGCNMACPFCDTDHQSSEEIDDNEIIRRIADFPTRHAVITGGEPGLQLTGEFIERLHKEGYFVQVETNGTTTIPSNADWITCSPKTPEIKPERIDEIKLLFMGDDQDDKRVSRYANVKATCRSLQPCDHSMTEHDPEVCHQRNLLTLEKCIAYIKAHPQWRLSLQTHKLLNIR